METRSGSYKERKRGGVGGHFTFLRFLIALLLDREQLGQDGHGAVLQQAKHLEAHMDDRLPRLHELSTDIQTDNVVFV